MNKQWKVEVDPEIVQERLCNQLFPNLTRIRTTIREILKERGAWPLPAGYLEERKREKMRALEGGREVEKNEMENKVEEGKEVKKKKREVELDLFQESLNYIVENLLTFFPKEILQCERN